MRRQPQDPDPDETVHPVIAGLLQEAGESGSGLRRLPGVLQLLLADPRRERGPDPVARRDGAAGVVDTFWSFVDLFDRVMGGGYAIAA